MDSTSENINHGNNVKSLHLLSCNDRTAFKVNCHSELVTFESKEIKRMTKSIIVCVHHVYHPKQVLHRGELTASNHQNPLTSDSDGDVRSFLSGHKRERHFKMSIERQIQGGLRNQQQKEQSSNQRSTLVKKILILLLSAQSIFSYGQHLTISAGAEKTVSGNQFGMTVMLETKKAWGVGTFFQTAISQNNEDQFVKDPFYGIAWQAPIARSERITFVGILRTGMVNQDFFAVVPSLETRIKVSRTAGVAVGAGIRSGYPSLSVKLSVKLFNRS